MPNITLMPHLLALLSRLPTSTYLKISREARDEDAEPDADGHTSFNSAVIFYRTPEDGWPEGQYMKHIKGAQFEDKVGPGISTTLYDERFWTLLVGMLERELERPDARL